MKKIIKSFYAWKLTKMVQLQDFNRRNKKIYIKPFYVKKLTQQLIGSTGTTSNVKPVVNECSLEHGHGSSSVHLAYEISVFASSVEQQQPIVFLQNFCL
jgi:hypothetical protein